VLMQEITLNTCCGHKILSCEDFFFFNCKMHGLCQICIILIKAYDIPFGYGFF